MQASEAKLTVEFKQETVRLVEGKSPPQHYASWLWSGNWRLDDIVGIRKTTNLMVPRPHKNIAEDIAVQLIK